MKTRRRVIVHISPGELVRVAMGRKQTFEVVNSPIPEGAIVVASAYFPESNTFGVCIEHESFDAIPVGERLPNLEPIEYREIDRG